MDWMGYFDKLLNTVIALLNPTWPQAIIIIFVISLCKFTPNIRRLLDRIKRVGREGISFSETEAQPVPPTSMEEIKDKTDQFSQNNTVTITTIALTQNALKEFINKQSLNDNEKISLLIKELAETFFYLRCQATYNSIFGSQIQLLKKLNLYRIQGLSVSEIEKYFNDASALFPDFYAKWNSVMYLNFLHQSHLITMNRDNYCITEFGVDFLVWLQRAGVSENKFL